MVMINPANAAHVDSGVYFIQFLWEECKAELEFLNQKDLNIIWERILSKSPRSSIWTSIVNNSNKEDGSNWTT